MLTEEQKKHAEQVEAEITGKATSQPVVQELITQEDENATYRVILLPIVQTLSTIVCPNWELQPSEHLQLVEAFIPLLKKYMPNIQDGVTLPPEVLALLTIAMIAAPRLAAQKPMREVKEDVKEAA